MVNREYKLLTDKCITNIVFVIAQYKRIRYILVCDLHGIIR